MIKYALVAELDEVNFDKLVKKYCSDSIYSRLKGKLKTTLRRVLEKAGLLNVTRLFSK